LTIIVLPQDSVRRSRHITCGASATLTTLGFILIAITSAGWIAATVIAVLNLAVLASHGLRHQDPFWNRLWVIAITAAPFALIGDWWCVTQAGLRYTQQGPFILVSPLYLPLLFPAAIFQIWYTIDMVRLRLDGTEISDQSPIPSKTFSIAIFFSVIFGCLYVPFYEFLAAYGDLWVYSGQAGLFNGVVPWYVIIAEIFQFSITPLAFTLLIYRNYFDVFLTGILVGLATVGSWAFSILLCIN